jgi:uncharacterized membrane protein
MVGHPARSGHLLPEPLHPYIVHFPIVIATALPLVVAIALWRMHDGAPVRTWGVVVVIAVLSWACGYVATRTGEQEEDRVEEVIADHDPIHEHEEAAELFLWVSGITLGLAVLGFAPGGAGRALRWLVLLGSVAGTVAVLKTGRLGGELIYEHGAASAYTDEAALRQGTADGLAVPEPGQEDDQ